MAEPEGQPKGEPDGQAAGLVRLALGSQEAGPAVVRRPVARDVVDGVLARKLLQGWIENRAQTMHPLTLNLGRLEPARAAVVLAAVAAGVAATGATAGRMARALAWVERTKGTAAQRTELAALVGSAPGLQGLVEPIRAADLAGHVYAATLGALDQRDAVNRAYADFLATRLAIPAELGRSLTRRFRG